MAGSGNARRGRSRLTTDEFDGAEEVANALLGPTPVGGSGRGSTLAVGLGPLVRRRRHELGLTQRELAARLGIPSAGMPGLERAATRWHSRLIVALARELRLPQLEVVLAAGVITDLPSLQAIPVDDALDAAGDPVLAVVANDAALRAEIDAGLAEFDAAQRLLLLAIVRQLRSRSDERRTSARVPDFPSMG